MKAWSDFWFAPEPAFNVRVARILVALQALWICLSRDYASVAAVPGVFWRANVSRWRFLIVPGHPGIEQALQVVAVIALVGAIVGIVPRLCCVVAALLLYHLGPMETAIWTTAPEARGLTLAPTALLILALARGDDEDGWVLRIVQVLVVEIYLFSAIGKLERTGIAWGSAERMRMWMLWFAQDDQSLVFTRVGPWLARHLWVCGVLGAATVAMEWVMPVMLFWKRSRLVLVPVALAFHVGVLVAMNIHVPEAWLIIVFVDWDSVRARLRRRARPIADPVPA